MIHFIRPFWFLMLIPAIFYLIWIVYAARQHNPWRNICDAHLLPALLQESPNTSRRFFYGVLFLFFIITIFALAGPAWKKTQVPIYRDINSLMIVLDLSPAMQLDDLKPNRMTRAKFKIRDLISASVNTQMGLVVFSGEAFVATPLSQDANTLSEMLDELHPKMMPLGGSDMGEGLTQGLTLLKQASVNSNFLLITASAPTASSWIAAKAIRDAGNQLNILAMVEQNAASQAIITRLQQLAKEGGGSLYLFTPDASDIQHILLNNKGMRAVKDENVENAHIWQDAGPWFCLFLIPLVLIVLRENA